MPFTIRPARPDETDAVVAAFDWLFAPPGTTPALWDEARARVQIETITAGEERLAAILVADPGDGSIAGLCTVSLDLRSLRFGLRAWVEDLAVDPERRSQGHRQAPARRGEGLGPRARRHPPRARLRRRAARRAPLLRARAPGLDRPPVRLAALTPPGRPVAFRA